MCKRSPGAHGEGNLSERRFAHGERCPCAACYTLLTGSGFLATSSWLFQNGAAKVWNSFVTAKFFPHKICFLRKKNHRLLLSREAVMSIACPLPSTLPLHEQVLGASVGVLALEVEGGTA